MIALRLAKYNAKRLWRRKGLRVAFLAVPLLAALLRAAFAGCDALRLIAELTPAICIAMVGAVLYAQWSMDAASGLVNGLRSCPVSLRSLVVSRALSGLPILAVQMIVFGGILAIRF